MRPPAEDRAPAEAAAGAPVSDVETAASDAPPSEPLLGAAEEERGAGPDAAASGKPDTAADIQPGSARGTRGKRGEALLAWLLPGSNPAGAIYGMIAIGALLAAESGLRDTYLETIGSALLALALYWLAHAYADLLGQRLQTRGRLTPQALAKNLLHDWAIMRGGLVPLVVLLTCWAAGASQETAVTMDLWVTAASLLTYELLAGLRARARPAELLLEGCVGATMGLGILALRVILH